MRLTLFCALILPVVVAACAPTGADGSAAARVEAYFAFGPAYYGQRAHVVVPIDGDFGCSDMGIGSYGPWPGMAGHWLDIQLIIGTGQGWPGEYGSLYGGCAYYGEDGQCFRWFEMRDGEYLAGMSDDTGGDILTIDSAGPAVLGELNRQEGTTRFSAVQCGELGPSYVERGEAADAGEEGDAGPWRLRFE